MSVRRVPFAARKTYVAGSTLAATTVSGYVDLAYESCPLARQNPLRILVPALALATHEECKGLSFLNLIKNIRCGRNVLSTQVGRLFLLSSF